MAPAEHTCSIHIDAPPEKVFAYIEDPVHFIAAMPANHHATVGAVTRTPHGIVTTYECRYRELGMHPTAVFTREQCVANESIVDRSSAGPFTCSPWSPEAEAECVAKVPGA